MNTENDIKHPEEEEQEIDLLELAGKLWAKRRMIIRWGIIGAVAGIIIALSIPKEYTTEIKLAPEATDQRGASGNLGALAAMAGISTGSTGGDAVSPKLYPDIVASMPFNVELFDVKITDIDGNTGETVREYIKNDLSRPWWSVITSLPGKAIGAVASIFRKKEASEGSSTPDPFHLTQEENSIVKALAARISVDVDAKTSIISIRVTMQDPMVSAILADTVASRLKAYVTDYRTNKARADMEYAQQLNDEARDEYYAAQQRYASYIDKNKGIILQSARTEEERLQNEMALAFNLYNSTAQQYQLAKAKVQEITPVYTIVQPATVPLSASKPSKMMIIIGLTFLALVASAAWILFGSELVDNLKKAAKTNKE